MIQAKHYLTLTRATAKRGLVAMLVATLIMTTACEKPIIEEDAVPTEANVVLRFTQYEHEAFSVGSGSAAATRTATDITELCSRINIAIFDGEGSK